MVCESLVVIESSCESYRSHYSVGHRREVRRCGIAGARAARQRAGNSPMAAAASDDFPSSRAGFSPTTAASVGAISAGEAAARNGRS